MRSVPAPTMHGIDARAQRVEELAVGDAGDRRGAAQHGGAAIGRVDHVQRDERSLRARVLPRRELADELVGGQLARLGQEPAQRDERLVARRRHAWVAGLDDVLDGLEGEQLVTGLDARVERLEHEADVVAEVVTGADVAREPARAAVEDRQPARTGVPFAARELVDLVARLAAEQLRELDLRARHEMHGERVDVAREAVGPVLAREARHEARRIGCCIASRSRSRNLHAVQRRRW